MAKYVAPITKSTTFTEAIQQQIPLLLQQKQAKDARDQQQAQFDAQLHQKALDRIAASERANAKANAEN